MKKTPSVFLRDLSDMNYVTETPNPSADWVFRGEGIPTRKYDGTCVYLDGDGEWWARREVKPGKPRPDNFIECERDENTNKIMGWVPISESGWAKFHAEALENHEGCELPPGTYELFGPRINGNPEKRDSHTLVPHDDASPYPDVERTYEGIRALCLRLFAVGIEGIVFHHPDGRYAKIKGKDFRTC